VASIRKIREGVYEVRAYLGRDEKGRPKQTSRTVHGSRKAAVDVGRQLEDSLGQSALEGASATLSDLLDQWLEARGPELSPTTLRNYRSRIELTIRPVLGSVRLSRLTAKHLDDLYGAMRREGKSAKTIRNAHVVISAALAQAVRWGWLKDNVATLARPPRISQRQIKAPSVDEVREIIAAAEERDPRLAPLLFLAALTGMRRGELCGLRWSDVDLDGGVLNVARSVVVDFGGLRVKAPKTDRPRKLALDVVGVELIRRHRMQVDEWAAQAETAIGPDAYVFSPDENGFKPFRPDNVTGFFTRVRDVVGHPDVRLHDLRHFTATQLIGAGVDVRTVAGRLGHSDASVTLRVYSHVLEERDRAAAATIGRLFQA
jgi:integrase